MEKETNKAKALRLKSEKEERLKITMWMYPDLWNYKPFSLVKKYAEIIFKYPDLENMDIELANIAANFRNKLIEKYHTEYLSVLADARNINLGNKYSEDNKMPEDLPALNFKNDCVVCLENKKGITLCPECWQKIRKALEIKAIQNKDGWDTWGCDCNSLDLSKVVELLMGDEEGIKILQNH